MKITVQGAAGEVTGSAYFIETDHARVLVDFGMFHVGMKPGGKNVVPAGVVPRQLDAVLVTHAHLDHVGRLPLLVKAGYRGPLFATDATRELAGLILRDSAKVQAHDLERQNRKLERAGKPLQEPLYHAGEVEQTEQLFRRVELGRPFEAAPGITARYANAGHMLGSASVQLSIREGNASKTVVFSGDVGPAGLPIVQDAEPFDRADLVFLESTYGDRDHKPLKETLAEFRAIIEDAVERKARVLVPAFAVGRTQQIIYHLDELFCTGVLDPFPVYVDSPMAIEAMEIYRRHPDLFDAEASDMERVCDIARRHRHVKPTPTAQDSMALNTAPGPCLIMAGAGMCNAGRILHHFKHSLWRPETAVMIVGYQSEGTLGRRLVDGDKSVKIFGEEVAVRARIHTLNGFSAHAGQTGLLDWLGHLAPSRPRVVLTHGEARGREPLAAVVRERYALPVALPSQGDVLEV